MPFVQVAPQLRPGAGNRVWGRYPAGHQGVLALACPHSTATLCPPVASTEGATGRRQAPDAQTSGWAGRGQPRCSRDPDLWVLSFSASSAVGQAAQPEPAATHVPRSMAQPLRARGSSFPHCHGLEAQWEVAGSGSPSPPLGGSNLWLPPAQPGPGEGGSWTWSRREQRWAVLAEGNLLLDSWPGSPQEQSLAREAERGPDGCAWGPGACPSQDAGACALQRAVQSPFPEGTALPSLTRGGNGPAAAGRLLHHRPPEEGRPGGLDVRAAVPRGRRKSCSAAWRPGALALAPSLTCQGGRVSGRQPPASPRSTCGVGGPGGIRQGQRRAVDLRTVSSEMTPGPGASPCRPQRLPGSLGRESPGRPEGARGGGGRRWVS